MVIETVGGRSPPTLSARQRTTQIDSWHLPVGMRLRISQSADSGWAPRHRATRLSCRGSREFGHAGRGGGLGAPARQTGAECRIYRSAVLCFFEVDESSSANMALIHPICER